MLTATETAATSSAPPATQRIPELIAARVLLGIAGGVLVASFPSLLVGSLGLTSALVGIAAVVLLAAGCVLLASAVRLRRPDASARGLATSASVVATLTVLIAGTAGPSETSTGACAVNASCTQVSVSGISGLYTLIVALLMVAAVALLYAPTRIRELFRAERAAAWQRAITLPGMNAAADVEAKPLDAPADDAKPTPEGDVTPPA